MYDTNENMQEKIFTRAIVKFEHHHDSGNNNIIMVVLNQDSR